MSFLKQLLATPRNPYIPNWDKIDPMEVEFSGCKLRLDLPPGSDPDFKDEIHRNFDIYNDFYEDNSYLKWYSQSNFLGKCLLRRAMVLMGKPWRGYDLGFIDVGAYIYNVIDLPNSMTCLNPHHFLQVIDKQQFFSYGPNSLGNVSSTHYSACSNWKVFNIDNITWIFFEAIRNRGANNPIVPDESSLITPLDDRQFLCISFSLSGPYKPVESCLLFYRDFIKTLIPRISLSISEDLAFKRRSVQSNSANTYPEYRDPLQWDSFYIPDWHEDISQNDGEKLLVYPIPKYNPNF